MRSRPRHPGPWSSQLPRILEQLGRAGDKRGLAKAHGLLSTVHWFDGRATAAAEVIRRVAEHALNAGDANLRSHVLAQLHRDPDSRPYEHSGDRARARCARARGPRPVPRRVYRVGKRPTSAASGTIRRATAANRASPRAVPCLGMPLAVAGCDRELAVIALSEANPSRAIETLLRARARGAPPPCRQSIQNPGAPRARL
jgi:hypothetical protein